MNNIEILREVALAKYNNINIYIKDNKYYYSDTDAEIDGTEVPDSYLILTDDEADKKTEERIKNLLWAFEPGFIICHSFLPIEAKEMISSFQEKMCEGANRTIFKLISDWKEFVSDAVELDGRGHFLADYDGEENTVAVLDAETNKIETFNIYRVN